MNSSWTTRQIVGPFTDILWCARGNKAAFMVDRIEFYIVNYHLPSLDTEQNYDRFNVKTKPFE